MASARSDHMAQRPVSAKIVVSGGFGVGKTTLVGAVSEITPLRTEASMTSAGLAVDDASHVSAKTTTTVAMDFGKLTVETGLVLYLFGTPGQDRFGFMWDDVVKGALGAIVLVDTRRLDQCYAAVDYFERRGLPFVVACNHFDGGAVHDVEEVRLALDVSREVPIFMTDAREPRMARDALLTLLEHVLARLEAAARPDEPASSAPAPQPSPPVAAGEIASPAAAPPVPAAQVASPAAAPPVPAAQVAPPVAAPPVPAAGGAPPLPAPPVPAPQVSPPLPARPMAPPVPARPVSPPVPAGEVAPAAAAPSMSTTGPTHVPYGAPPEAVRAPKTMAVGPPEAPVPDTGWWTEVGPGGILYFAPKGS